MIDRNALIRRHNPTLAGFAPLSPLSVGNGEFAFTVDSTGLQTFPELYRNGCPLGTAAHWGWHSASLPDDLNGTALRTSGYDTYGRLVGYVTDRHGQERLFDYRRQNPHRLHLGRIGLEIRCADGSFAMPEQIAAIHQTLDLWSGQLESRFTVEGVPVVVLTVCHPAHDLIAVRVESPLIATGRLQLFLTFPYGSPEIEMADWNHPERHATTLVRHDTVRRRADLSRALDDDRYNVNLAWSERSELWQTDSHTVLLSGAADGASSLELVCHFLPGHFATALTELPTVDQTVAASAVHWQRFWSVGGIIDLSTSTDPRASELERRIVLSQFVTALHCAGSLPPAETGLLCNSWYGKFHLEMHWWHGVHLATWGRLPLLAKSLGWYARTLPLAQEIAARQGYQGARWPKMVGPDGHDSPSPIGPLLIWQQPHPIYYAELCYRQSPERATLDAWRDVVFESADFMASYAVYDQGRYVLGPPLKTVSENTDARTATNPTFELAYWRFGLRVAGLWRERLGLAPDPAWEAVRQGLATLPEHDGVYLLQEGLTDTYSRWNWEHPAHLGVFGMLPGDGADQETMRQTVRRVMETWQWDQKSWGWDFPLVAMAAARSGEPNCAVDALLLDVPKNHYLPNGHVYQREDLPAYLPANGGLLTAVGMMAAGWEGGPDVTAPGFPTDGRWSVQFEGIVPLL